MKKKTDRTAWLRSHLLLLCWGAALVFYLAASLGLFCFDALGAATGSAAPRELSVSDFTLSGLVLNADGTLTATDNDPQMIYSAAGQRVRSISYTLQSPAHGETALYYTRPGQSDFSLLRTVLSPFGETQSMTYVLSPFGSYDRLRLDVGSLAGDVFAFSSITLNPRLPFGSYFVWSLRSFAALLVLPALAAGLAASIWDAADAWRARRHPAG